MEEDAGREEGLHQTVDPRLAGCWNKVERADEHRCHLYREIQGFLNREPNPIITERNPETGRAVLRVRDDYPPPPLRLSIIVGDVAHNLRSCLDHLAFQLVRSNGGTPTFATGYPIYSARPTSSQGEAVRKRKVQGMSDAAIADIERLQPYNGRYLGYHPLEMLRGLSNWDKHNTVVLTVAQAKTSYQVTYRSGVQVAVERGEARLFEAGAIMEIIEPPADDASEMYVEHEAAVEIFFDESGPGKGRGVLPLLYDLQQFVGRLILDFDRVHFRSS